MDKETTAGVGANAKLDAIIASAVDAIVSINEHQQVVLFNSAAERMFGLKAEEAIGRHIKQFIPERLRTSPMRRVGSSDYTVVSNRDLEAMGWGSGLRANGEEFPLDASISSAEIAGEKLFTFILRDASDRLRAEAALQKQARLIDLAPAATLVREVDGTISFWSQGAESLYGWRREEAIGRRSHDLLRTGFPEPLETIVTKLQRGENWFGELRHYTKDGRLVIVQSHWLGQLTCNGTVAEILESNVDITDRKRAEESLRESEARFHMLADNIPQLAWMADENGSVFWYNQRWFDYTGTSLEEMQGWGWQKVHHPDHLQRVIDKISHCFHTGESWEDTFPLRRQDGQYHWFLSRATPIRNELGHVVRWFGTNTDITREREAAEVLAQAKKELKAHAEKLEQAVKSRTAELEAFCYSLSHDMRGTLRRILSLTTCVLEDCGPELATTDRDYLERILGATKGLDRLIQDVLALSRISHEEVVLEVVDLEKLLMGIIRERPEMQEPAAEVRVEGPLPLVLGQEASLTQCLTNLLGNAVKFVKPGVKPRVRVRAERGEAVRTGSGIRAPVVRIWVEDNGIGIEKSAHKKIFEHFQRSRKASGYEGSGIGLAIVRKAAERMGGQVGVESEEDKGSRFWVELKAAGAKVES